MTKTLNTDLSQHAAPAPRAAKRPRTWLVALLGFGAADLLVLNLWAVPNLITNTTTTDMRAAQSGDMHAASEVAAVVQQQAEAAPSAEPTGPQDEAHAAAPQNEQVREASPSEQAAAPQNDQIREASPSEQAAAPQNEQIREAEPSEPAAALDSQVHAAPRAEAPPGGAQPTRTELDVPSDPAVARAFAIRAAQRALRVALQDRAAMSGSSAFAALTADDQPLTQVFFSLGNFTLGPNGKQTLERTLTQLTGDQQDRAILVVGAADPSGTEQVNSKLSDARAQSVAEWLLAHGVDAQRIQTRAIGHEGAVGSTLDRRVDIWLGGSR